MLAYLAMFFKWASVAALLLMLIGLYKPWWVLWWEATQNRLKVIKLYVGIAVVSYIISWFLEYLN